MPLRVGLVGLGDAGRQHARALARLAELEVCEWTAVCARSADRVASFRAANPVPERARGYSSLDALLDAGACDAVILATPDHTHVAQLRQCASRGLHVLVEKPLALERDSARAALELARAARVHVAVGYHLRHHAGHRLVFERREALIGPLRRIELSWAWPDPAVDGWRAHGHGRFWSLAALGTHGIDLARWFVGAEPRRCAWLLDPPMAVDHSAELTLGFDGAVAHVGVSIAYRARSRLVLVGERGEIECRGTLGARGDGEIFVREHDHAARPVALEFTVVNPYQAQLEAFVAAISAAAPIDLDDALGNLAVLETIAAGATPIS